MEDAERKRMFDLLGRLTRSIAAAVGSNCEVVLHDFTNPESSIVAIENGHITGRKVGGGLDAFGYEVLRNDPQEDVLNYRAKTRTGRSLRSSSIFLRDDTGKLLGAMCVNMDITGLLAAQQLIDSIVTPERSGIQETFEHDVDEVFGLLFNEAVRARGKAVTAMDRDDRIAVISYLESKGAFLIRYSMERAAQLLNISKFTVYNYLEKVREQQKRHRNDSRWFSSSAIHGTEAS